ncbi:MAG: DUF2231 domain-containing protein [Candidatus Rokubacteria bacterium]|nr:DUF2231 domain-containing protein [Candidatus Rokubacteria bacterium]
MSTPASIARHPVHPMLIVFPITFFVAAPVLDIAHLATGDAMWARIAFWDIVLGIVSALAAAVPGFIDYLSLAGRAARIATYHMVLNLTVVGLFGVSLLLRGGAAQTALAGLTWLPVALSIGAALILAVSGWLGGSLVYEHGVGVSRERDARETIGRRRAA